MSQPLPAWQTALEAEFPEPSLRRTVLAAAVAVAIGFGSFFVWSLTARLDSAVPAAGSIVVEGKNKTVSLLDPGILKEMLVKEGDHIQAGQPLLRLDETQAQAQFGQLKGQYWATQSKLARLTAEQADADAVTFPPELIQAAADPGIALIVENEKRLFLSRRQTYHGSLALQDKRIAQFNEQIAAMQAQANSAAIRLRFINEELRGVMSLLAKGFATKTKAMELQRTQAELNGTIGEMAARQAEARQNIAQAELEAIRIRDTWHADAGKEMQESQALLGDLSQRMRAAADILERKMIPAPETGTVTNIKFFTTGSSIGAGQPVLDIVPHDNRLLIEANVSPGDIEQVAVGQKVNVRLSAYKQHKVPVLTGRLTYVSADRQVDQRGEPFFVARAELDPGTLDGLKGVSLYPGMPADVLIVGGERRAIDYFISPITDSFRRSFIEE